MAEKRGVSDGTSPPIWCLHTKSFMRRDGLARLRIRFGLGRP